MIVPFPTHKDDVGRPPAKQHGQRGLEHTASLVHDARVNLHQCGGVLPQGVVQALHHARARVDCAQKDTGTRGDVPARSKEGLVGARRRGQCIIRDERRN